MRPLAVIVLLSAFGFQLPAAYAITSSEKADELFLEGKYDNAIAQADKAIDAGSGKKYELYYLKGLGALKLGKFAESRKAFEYVTELYPRSDRAFDSYVGIGDAYYLEGNTSGALRAYREAADKFADNKNIVVVRQRIAECMAKPEMQEKAKEVKEPKGYIEAKPAEKPRKAVNFVPRKKDPARIETPPRETAGRDSLGQFSVQVGSFKSKSNAAKLASKLSARHYEARVELPAGSSDKLYRVKVGRLSSREEAENLAVKLKRGGCPTRVCQEN